MEASQASKIVDLTERTTRFKHQVIVITGKRQDEITSEAWDAIVGASENPGQYAFSTGCLFLREGRLVFLDPTASLPQIKPATRTMMFTLANQAIEWQVEARKENRVSQQPQWLSSVLLESPRHDLPELRRVASMPFFDRSGRYIHQDGYDKDSAIWLAKSGLSSCGVPLKVKDQQVREAVAFFADDLLVNFPFATPSDRANAIAQFITPVVGEMIQGPKMAACVEAPVPGSGKSKFAANLLGIFSTGAPFRVTPMDKKESEIRKTITASLIAGDPVLLYDNVAGFVNSPALAAVLSATKWSDRVLGGSVMVTLPITAQIILTGNNIKMSGELADRMLRIRLVPNTQHPRQRKPETFKHPDIDGWLADHRDKAVHNIAILIQNWITKGCNYSGPVQGTFESYCHVVGGVLESAGINGFLENRDEFATQAATSENEYSMLVDAWLERHGQNEVTANQLNVICEDLEILTYLRGKDRQVSSLSRFMSTNLRERVFNKHMIILVQKPAGTANRFRLHYV